MYLNRHMMYCGDAPTVYHGYAVCSESSSVAMAAEGGTSSSQPTGTVHMTSGG